MYIEKKVLIIGGSRNVRDKEFTFEEIDTIQTIEYELENTLNIVKGDRFFFMPGCNVPRFKIRNVLKNYSASISKTIDGSNLVVVNDDMFKHLVRIQSYKKVSKDLFLSFLNHHLLVKGATELKNALLQHYDSHVYILSYDFYQLHNSQVYLPYLDDTTPEFEKIKINYQDDDDWDEDVDSRNPVTDCDIMYFHDDLDTELAKKFLSNSDNKKIIHQDDLLKIINENNTFIDENKYYELRNLCLSPDQGNLVLAMEIMSNCDYDDSYVYLMLLISEFGAQFASVKERNHVNFKSMLNYIGFKPGEIAEISFKDFVSVMKAKGKFTRSNCQKLFPEITRKYTETNKYNMGNNLTTQYTEIVVLPLEEHLDKEEEDTENE